MDKTKSGVDVLTFLQMLFLHLKLNGRISWSWDLVFIPTWISAGLIIIYVTLTLVITILKARKK